MTPGTATEAAAAPPGFPLVRDALALVLDIDGASLRPDTPLADLGADSLALVCVADAVEDAAAAAGRPVVVPDAALRAARTAGDLAADLVAGPAADPAADREG